MCGPTTGPRLIGVMTSGLHAIAIAPDKLTGGADPRREGVAAGQ